MKVIEEEKCHFGVEVSGFNNVYHSFVLVSLVFSNWLANDLFYLFHLTY